METFYIAYVETEIPGDSIHFITCLMDDVPYEPSTTKGLYLKFMLYTPDNERMPNLFLGKTEFEKHYGMIEEIKDFSNNYAGSRIIIVIGDELSKIELSKYVNGETLYNTLINERHYHVTSFSVDLSIRDNKGVILHKEIEKLKNIKFKDTSGISHYTSGYDVDACFGGEPDAYWNID